MSSSQQVAMEARAPTGGATDEASAHRGLVSRSNRARRRRRAAEDRGPSRPPRRVRASRPRRASTRTVLRRSTRSRRRRRAIDDNDDRPTSLTSDDNALEVSPTARVRRPASPAVAFEDLSTRGATRLSSRLRTRRDFRRRSPTRRARCRDTSPTPPFFFPHRRVCRSHSPATSRPLDSYQRSSE